MRIFNIGFVAAIFLVFLAAIGCETSTSEHDAAGIVEISQEEFLTHPPENVLVVDVRSVAEFSAGHVPNAINIPHDELSSRISDLGASTDRPIVLYCKSGRRAGMAGEVLLDAGYTELHHLTGDMNAWQASGLPTQ